MKDAVCELAERCAPCAELDSFITFHRAHPEVFDFLVREVELRIRRGQPAFSINSLWAYARWRMDLGGRRGATFLLNDHNAPLYGRALVIIHPEFNGLAELRKSKADAIFGTRIAAPGSHRPRDFARRLEWADGTGLEDGWRPAVPHVATRSGSLRPNVHATTAKG